ncbi:MAG: hypothetical protein P4L84_03900 [Isosphaeraceae bacterium]|nr:hypothetical protein [Isosphaeraceae bacterium]
MPNETLPTPRAASALEAKGASFRQETAALAGGLERIRATVLERLDKVETALRERASRAPVEESQLSERDSELRRRAAELQQRQTELQQRTAELEEAQRRLRAERDRWENERATLLEQLEHDRILLAEAWERLEREKLEHPDGPSAPSRNANTERVPARVARPVVASDDENPVAQAILRQFQAVRRDVRRNANGPTSS